MHHFEFRFAIVLNIVFNFNNKGSTHQSGAFVVRKDKGLEGSVVNDCRWQSEPTTAPLASGQVPSAAPKQINSKYH
jgi:hypothetical protein